MVHQNIDNIHEIINPIDMHNSNKSKYNPNIYENNINHNINLHNEIYVDTNPIYYDNNIKHERRYTADQVLHNMAKNQIRKSVNDNHYKFTGVNNMNYMNENNINSSPYYINNNENDMNNNINPIMYKKTHKKNNLSESDRALASKMKNKFKIFNKNKKNNTINNKNNVDNDMKNFGNKNMSPKVEQNTNIIYYPLHHNPTPQPIYENDDCNNINNITNYYNRMNIKDKNDYYLEKNMYYGDINEKSHDYTKNNNIYNYYNHHNNNMVIYDKRNINVNMNQIDYNNNQSRRADNQYKNPLEGMKINNYMNNIENNKPIPSSISGKKNHVCSQSLEGPFMSNFPDADINRRPRYFSANYSNNININPKRNIRTSIPIENNNINNINVNANNNYYNSNYPNNYCEPYSPNMNNNMNDNMKYHRCPVESDIVPYNNRNFNVVPTAEDKAIYYNMKNNLNNNNNEYEYELDYNYNRRKHEKCIIS
eukprot:jgi/Orpsp1_1/1179902/evm.model.c7180000071281.1